MRILLLGSGGREHALAWRCAHEGHEVHVAPGSDGIAMDAPCHALALTDLAAATKLATGLAPDLVIVGPEQPLVDGLADRLRAAGLAVFGPSAAAAELEGSKAHAKAFMVRHGVPTARHVRVDDLAAGLAAVRSFAAPPVVKASGLAAGKGVTVAETFEEAELALRSCLEDQVFGTAGACVVLEERMTGAEASLFVVTDGERWLYLPPAQDHKRLRDGDSGPNTGGMGAYSPAPICSPAVLQRTAAEIVEPTLAGLRAEGRPFVGALFIGLMIDAHGTPRVVEYNCRFGDPEIQPVLFGLQAPVVPHLHAAALGRLRPPAAPLPAVAAATVVIAAAGYPGRVEPGTPIRGLEATATLPDVKVFHAGTRRLAAGAAPQGREEHAGPQGREDHAGPQGREDRAGPQGREDRAGPQGREDRAGPQGRKDHAGPQGREDRAGPQGHEDHTSPQGRGDLWVTAGGRVLGVCARGRDLPAALSRAYAAVDRLEIAGSQFRRDIGARA